MLKPLLSCIGLCALMLSVGCASVIDASLEAPINQDRGERTLGSSIDDSTIETYAAVNIKKADPQFESSRVIVVSFNGMVLIVGQVPTEALRQKAENTVNKLKKVRKVYNELTISGPTTLLASTSDTWLTAKVKTQMLSDKKIPAGRIKVVTENGIVYLMGLIKPSEAERAVELIRQIYGVQKIVKVFEYI